MAFPGIDAGWLAWIALVPLLVAIARRAPGEAFAFGFLTGFLAFAIVLSWIRLFGIVPWLLLAAYLALYVGAFAGLYRWLAAGRPTAWSLWLVPLVWTGMEYARSIGVFGFPWALLGLSQHDLIPVLQAARITGVYGISFLVALVNAAIAGMIVTRRPVVLIAPALVVIAVSGWGAASIPPAARGSLRVATLQTNVAPPLKFDPAAAQANLRLLQGLIREAAGRAPELIVMPETALPSDLFGSGGLLGLVGRWAHDARATVLATSLEGGASNIVVAVAPSGMPVGRYDKVRLVAFAENGIHPGFRHDPLWTPLGRIGVAICFESIFPEVSRQAVQNGAQLLAVISNDAWSDGTAGPAQHARFAPFRAVESGRWLIHATNSGISQVVDPAGRVVATLPAGRVAVLESDVALSEALTPYARWGDWFAQAALAAVAGAAILLKRREVWEEARRPAFQTAAAVSVLPLIAVWVLLIAGAPWWAWTAAVLGFLIVFTLGRIGGPTGADPSTGWRHAAGAVLAGSVVVLALAGIIVAAFRANQIPVIFTAPAGGWTIGILQQLAIAAALEGWLRGRAFGALAAWKGSAVAVGATVLVGMLLQSGLPAEAMAWALATGIAFGLIRARTGNTLGLIIPHALGNVLLAAFLTAVR